MAAEGAEGAEAAGGNGSGSGSADPPAPQAEPPPPAPLPSPPPTAEPGAAAAPQPPQSCNGAAAPPEEPPPQDPPQEPPLEPQEPQEPQEPPQELPPQDPPQEPPQEPPQDPPPEAPLPPELEKLWQAAQSNPHDFSAWTELLALVEQENQLGAARRAFDGFFAHYPYCYGYWKKYADMERRLGGDQRAQEVFERGLQSIPLSMDLWIHYISFLQSSLDMSRPEAAPRIRGVFEAAVAAAGLDFRSDKLWELYVEWEREQGELRAVTAIYDRVLSIPTQLYSQHWERFKEHVLQHPPRDILSPEELLWVRSKLSAEPPKAPEPPEPPKAPEPPPEEAPQPGGGAQQEDPEPEQERIRELVISMRQQIHAHNEAEVGKRWSFEDGIKRPYFHVKPLERAQLRNWREYLDWELSGGNHDRCIVLFERCVIACALYEEFWIKYVRFLEPRSVPGARSVFQRACGYHLPRKPSLHLLWAAFEEKHGNPEESRRILRSLEAAVPGLAMVRLRRVSLERRLGDLEAAERLLREAVLANQGLPLASFFAIKLARQAGKVQRNLGKARRVLLDALDKEPDNARLHANLLELEFGADVRQNEGNTLRCLERALRSPLAPDAKLLFSQRRLEFLEDFGSSIHSLLTAYDDHQRILKQHAARKRALENGAEEPDDKRLRPDDTSLLGPLGFSGGDGGGNPSYSYWYQHGYGYNYQTPWSYNQYYGQS